MTLFIMADETPRNLGWQRKAILCDVDSGYHLKKSRSWYEIPRCITTACQRGSAQYAISLSSFFIVLWEHWTYKMLVKSVEWVSKVEDILTIIFDGYGLICISWTISPLMIVRISVHYLIIIIDSLVFDLTDVMKNDMCFMFPFDPVTHKYNNR